VSDDTDEPPDEIEDEADAPLAKVIPFSRTMTAKARKAVRSLGFGGKPTA